MRTDVVKQAADQLSAAATRFIGQPLKSASEREAALDMIAAVSDARAPLPAAIEADALSRVLHDRLRPTAQSMRRYALRHHLQVVRCPWPELDADPSACAIIAGAGIDTLSQAALAAGLRIAHPAIGRSVDLDLWHRIAGSETVVVELRDEERETQWPRACFAIGIALTIGRVVVVVADRTVDMPFDLNLVTYDRSSGVSLEDIIVQASCIVSSGDASPDAVRAAARFALDVEPPTDAPSRHMASLLAQRIEGSEVDPIAVRRALTNHFAWSGSHWRVEQSSFVPFYPDAGRRPSVFHVMPFVLDRTMPGVSHAVAAACGTGWAYVRGDTEPDLRIIDRIWEGLGQASMVIVDLTGLNPNVCLEFAVALTLGRPLMLVHAADTWDRKRLFPEIAHLSIEKYVDVTDLERQVRARLST